MTSGDRSEDVPQPSGVDPSDLDIDLQQGAHDLPDISAQIDDTSKLNQYIPDYKTTIKHLSVNKYESVQSTIREYISNMNASCLEAQEMLGDDYTPLIHITYYPASRTLIMEDNGMGFSRDRVDGPGLHMGYSTNRFDDEKGGKYGIGLLSGLKAVGLRSAFFMHSRSRRTDEYIKGAWTAYGFVDEEKLQDRLDENQYGALFEFPLKEEPDFDVRSAVKKLAEYCRVPVLYSERDENGAEIYTDEFGGRSETPFLDKYDNPGAAVVFENEYIRAVNAPDASGDTILLDVPIKRNYRYSRNINDRKLPFRNVDILLKSENQQIIEGPHEGLTRIGDEEYTDLADDIRGEFIQHERCAPNDIWTPSPAGDRDRLEETPDFWEWVADKLADEFVSRMHELESQVLRRDVLEIDKDLLTFGVEFACTLFHSTPSDPDRYHDRINENYPVEISREVVEEIVFISDEVEVCPRWDDDERMMEYNGVIGRSSREERRLHEVMRQHRDGDGEVYMANRPSVKKARVVWLDDEDNIVVQVSKNNYEKYEQMGWNYLHDIDSSTIDSFDVPEEVKEPFRRTRRENPNAGLDAPDRSLTLHRLEWREENHNEYNCYRKKEKATAAEIRDYLTGLGSIPVDGDEFDTLILFPKNSDHNLTEYRDVLAIDNTRVATCAVKTWEYLKDISGVKHADDVISRASETVLTTSEGDLSVLDAASKGDGVLLHLLPDEAAETLQQQPELDRAREWVEENSENVFVDPDDDEENVDEEFVYAPVTLSEVRTLRPLLPREDVLLVTLGRSYPVPDEFKREGFGSLPTITSDQSLYVYARLKDWEGSTTYKSIKKRNASLSNEQYRQTVDSMASMARKGYPPIEDIDADSIPSYDNLDNA